MLRNYVVNTLADCARRAIALNRAKVIAVTGSVGKSSAKEAIATLFANDSGVRVSQKNYNSEIGLPLAVLGLPNGQRSALKWAQVLWSAKRSSARPDPTFPKTLVLEMGVDHPGDMAHLVSIAPPKVAVVTAIGEAHYEFFGSLQAIINEKMFLVESLAQDGVAILNRDDQEVWNNRDRAKCRIISYGFAEDCDVRALEGSMRYENDPTKEAGVHVKIACNGSLVPFFFAGVLGAHSLYAPLAAIAVGLSQGMNLVEISTKLLGYLPPPGRMRAIAGIKRTTLIDDTYNASPRSTKAALRVLSDFPVINPSDDKRIVVLGDMLELGTISFEAHREIGRAAAQSGAQLIVFVGERMGDAMHAAVEAGAPPDRVYHFSTTDEAGRFVQQRMKQGDVVLIKGSQGMRMERVVKELMAEPLRANELLVRQDPEWS